MVVSVLKLQIKFGSEKSFERFVQDELRPAYLNSGCHEFKLYRQKDSSFDYLWVETWTNEEHIDRAHQKHQIGSEAPFAKTLQQFVQQIFHVGRFTPIL